MARPLGQPKLGGRQKGTPNKASAAREAKIAASGLTPLDYMLTVLRNEENEAPVRLDAAKAAAPYVHAKLQPVDPNGSTTQLMVIEIRKPGD